MRSGPLQGHGATATSIPVRGGVPIHPVWLEDIAVDTFMVSSFGRFVMVLFQPLFRASAWQTFSVLACGWALATERHTITTYLWLTGAATLKHFSRFYVFLGCPFYHARWRVWTCIIRHAAQLIPADAPVVIEFDDTTKKKA